MCNDRIWILLTRKLSGEATQTELEELNVLLASLPEGDNSIEMITGIWNSSPSHDEEFMEATYLAHMERMKDKGIALHSDDQKDLPEEESTPKKWYSVKNIAFAAVALLVLAAGSWFIPGVKKGTAKENLLSVNEIKTPKGARTKVTLPDGSNVWLNAGSKLSYGKEFGKKLREVQLTGEGYFDVVKMADKPFVIHTSAINIKVLGTVFNVKAYPEEKLTETSLLRGSIEVTIKNRTDSKIVLSPNEKLIVENEPELPGVKQTAASPVLPAFSIHALKADPVDGTVAEAGWVHNKLVFSNESLEDVALKMQRWYNVIIDINDPKLAQKRFTGNFEKEDVLQALEALKMITHFEYKQTGERITIYN